MDVFYLIVNIILFLIVMFLIFWKKKNEDKDNLIETFINKHYKKIVFCLFTFVIATSLIKIADVMKAIHVDELGMYHDAKLLAKYGYDRYLKKYPVYLINYSSGQSAMYAYLVVILIKIFGESILLIRIPIIIFRILSYIAVYSILKNENDKLKKVIYLFIFATIPFFVMQTGIGLDCNLLVHFIIIAVSLLIKGILNKKNIYLLISGVFFGLSLYTYALSYLILPIFLLLTSIYLLYIKEFKIKQVLLLIIPTIIIAIPLILFVLVNQGIIDEINSFITIPKLLRYRSDEFGIKYIEETYKILFALLDFDDIPYNSSIYFGTIFYISIPFALYGFLYELEKLKESIKNKTFRFQTIILFTFLSCFLVFLFTHDIKVNKANTMFFAMAFFIGTGIIEIFNNRKYLIKFVIGVYIVNTILFIQYYCVTTNNVFGSRYFFIKSDYMEAFDYVDDRNDEKVFLNITNKYYFDRHRDYLFMRYNLTIDNYDKPVNGKIYRGGVPKEIDNNTIVISDIPLENYNNKKIGDYYIITQ